MKTLTRYLEYKETAPSFEQFRADRSHYLEQIWINVWINKATNAVNKKDKKVFLAEKGFEVEGVDRKLINQLFRTEIRNYQPFDVNAWIDSVFLNNEKAWQDQYSKARKKLFERLEEERTAKRKTEINNTVMKASHELLQKEYTVIYLYIRAYVARHITNDLMQNPKYELKTSYQHQKLIEVKPSLVSQDYIQVSDFFEELTGAIQETFDWGRI
ncbi:hypothetical protein [Bacillus sp. T3]|uniref:hypothetical protein n=1 Tax=Bacillus sp. T3 TaxID=467262 RepID=UPI0029820977|nr:hypothetical protein [Bacillus sp. T3]